jgi:hypothetical protein
MHAAANSYVLGMMTTYITAAARAWTGPMSAVHYGRARGEGMTWIRVRSIEGALEVAHWMRGVCSMRMFGMRAWRDTLGSEELRVPAFMCDAAHNCPWSELEALRYATSQGRASTHGVAEALRASMGTLRAQDEAWVADFDQGHHAVMSMIAAPEHLTTAGRLRELMAAYKRSEILIKIGEYKKGADAVIDEALDKWPRIMQFLRQGTREFTDFDDTLKQLKALVG